MSLLEYLQIITTILNKHLTKLDEFYNECKLMTNKYGTRPICFTIVDGHLWLVARKNVYSMSNKGPKTTNILAGFYKSSLSDYYNCEEGGIYAYNKEALKEAIEYINEYSNDLRNIFQRMQFYSSNDNIIIEFEKFNPNNPQFVIEITKGIRGANHLTLDIRKRYFETVDLFTVEMLKEIKIPDNLIPDFIKEKLKSNNFSVDEFTEEELDIHPWHSDYIPRSEYFGTWPDISKRRKLAKSTSEWRELW